MRPTVSVVIPTYNRADVLRAALLSVAYQTTRPREIIIVEDPSPQSSLVERVVDEFRKATSFLRVKHIRNEEKMGAAASRNIGVASARGKFIAFLDSDDVWLPQKLELQLDKVASEGVPVVYTGLLRIQWGKVFYQPFPWVKKRRGYIHDELIKGNFIGTSCLLVEKKLFEDVGGFDPQLPRCQDWDLVLRLSREVPFGFVELPQVVTFHRKDSITADNKRAIVAYKTILNKYWNEFSRSPKVLAKRYSEIAHYMLLEGLREEALKYAFRAFSIYPLGLRGIVLLVSAVFGSRFYRRVVSTYYRIQGFRTYDTA